ncbi:integrase [Pseudomonas plecoglossicida]|nr:integrase [Pseudomonas plecoglossicida]
MPEQQPPEKPKADSDQAARNISEPGKYPSGSIPGMYLHVKKASKVWALKYRLRGEEGTYTIGRFPDFSYTRAVELAQEARTWVAEGLKPLDMRSAREEAEQAQLGETFSKVCSEWLANRADLSAKTLLNYRATLDRHVLPALGALPVHQIEYRHIKKVLTALAVTPAAAAHALVTMRAVLDYALELELIDDNVAARRGKGLIRKRKTIHHAAIERSDDLKEFLRRLEEQAPTGRPTTWALWLLVLLPVRPGELCAMRWEDIHGLDKEGAAEWRYVVPKTGKLHVVPLPLRVVGQLNLIWSRRAQLQAAAVPSPFGGGVVIEDERKGWVFASTRGGAHLSTMTLLKGIRALGYEKGELTSHGFRSTFRSLGHELLGIEAIVLELCLGHRMPGPLSDTYARAHLLPQRREAMLQWSDFVEGLWFEVVYGVSREDAAQALTPKGLGKE